MKNHTLGALVVTTLTFSFSLTAQIAFNPVQEDPFNLAPINNANGNCEFGDLNGDGKLDFIHGRRITYGLITLDLVYAQNYGTASNPDFGTVQYSPFGIPTGWDFCSIRFVDLDNDEDLDIFAGGLYSGSTGPVTSFEYAENIGSATNPIFGSLQQNPFGLSPSVNLYAPNLAFADLDNDGDLDLMTSPKLDLLNGNSIDNDFNYFENTGTDLNPIFSTETSNPFGLDAVLVGENTAIDFIDYDGDDDMDILAVGQNEGQSEVDLYLIINIGSQEEPLFMSPLINPFGISLPDDGRRPLIDVTDMNDDGEFDILIGSSGGEPYLYYEQTCTAADDPAITISPSQACFGEEVMISVSPSASLNGANSWSLYEGSSCGQGFIASDNAGTFTIIADCDNTYSVRGEGGCADANSAICSSENLIVSTTIDLTLSWDGNQLSSNQANSNYQWLDCTNQFQPLPGEVSISYAPATPGIYAVEISNGNCIDTSECYDLTELSVLENESLEFSVYPNPSNGEFTIELNKTFDQIDIEIHNNLGQLILRERYENVELISIDESKLNVGSYLIQLIPADDQSSEIIRLIKIEK